VKATLFFDERDYFLSRGERNLVSLFFSLAFFYRRRLFCFPLFVCEC
jgi:hypothetical protein